MKDLSKIAFTVLLASTFAFSARAFAETKTIEMVAVEEKGGKYWRPDHIEVQAGDTVRIHAVSKIPEKGTSGKKVEYATHSLAIDAYKIDKLINGKGETFEFVADKVGQFPIVCKLHPAHHGSSLEVKEAKKN